MSLITIDQLLESVNYPIEPKWVTKDKDGTICIFGCDKPETAPHSDFWAREEPCIAIHHIKLADFDNKPWQECIYEVPRKEEPKDKIKIGTLYIDKNVTFGDGDDDDVGVVLEDYEVQRKTTGKIELLTSDGGSHPDHYDFMQKINELVDAVNELKGAKNETH